MLKNSLRTSDRTVFGDEANLSASFFTSLSMLSSATEVSGTERETHMTN